MLLEIEAAVHNWKKSFLEIQQTEASSDRFTSLTTRVAEDYANLPLNRFVLSAKSHSKSFGFSPTGTTMCLPMTTLV